MADQPTADELKKLILREKGEAWLQKELKEHEEIYGNAIGDPALKLWMIAKNAGIDVADIRAEGGPGRAGDVLLLKDFTQAKAEEETKLGETKENGLYSIEALVTSEPELGETRKKGEKLSVFVQDPTGKAKIVAYNEEAIQKMANAKLRPGQFYQFTALGMLAGPAEGNRRAWKHLTVPPFCQFNKVEGKDFRAVYRDPNTDAYEDGDAMFLEGVITVLDPITKEVCDVCGKWTSDDQEKNQKAHKNCGEDPGVKEETSYEGTIALGNNSHFRWRWPAYRGEPSFPVGQGWVRLYGIWKAEYKTLNADRYEVLVDPKGPKRAPPPAAPKPKEAPKAPKGEPTSTPASTPKPASPKPAKAPEPEPEGEDTPQEESEAPEASGSALGTEFALPMLQTFPEGLPRPTTRSELEKVGFRPLQKIASHLGIDAKQKLPVLLDAVSKALSAPSTPAKREEAPKEKPQKDLMKVHKDAILGEIKDAAEAGYRMKLEELTTSIQERVGKDFDQGRFNMALKLAKQGGAISESEEGFTFGSGEPEVMDAPRPKETRIPEQRGEPTAIPERVMKHFEEFVRDFQGKNRLKVVVNLAVQEGAVEVSDAEVQKAGDKAEAVRRKLIQYVELGRKEGFLDWKGEWQGDKPPAEIIWIQKEE